MRVQEVQFGGLVHAASVVPAMARQAAEMVTNSALMKLPSGFRGTTVPPVFPGCPQPGSLCQQVRTEVAPGVVKPVPFTLMVVPTPPDVGLRVRLAPAAVAE